MPTPPFPQDLLDRMKSTTQSVRWSVEFGLVRQFRAYCCNIDSDTIMGVTKEPVPLVDISPSPVCLGNSITVTITNSYAPGSSVTTKAIDFGDSTVIDPAGNTETHTYVTTGIFTIEVTVRETGGDEQTTQTQILVEDCTESGTEPGIVGYIYVAADGNGVWYWDGASWNDRSLNLIGSQKNVNYIVQQPGTKHLQDINHILLIATDNGILRTFDGGRSWEKIALPDPSNAEFADAPAVVIAELAFYWVDYDPTDVTIIYAMGVKASVSRQWLFKSSDNLLSWISRGIVTA